VRLSVAIKPLIKEKENNDNVESIRDGRDDGRI
jgi:hypothetical protein